MKRLREDILLPAGPVRWLGIGLVIAGLLLPWSLLTWHTWQAERVASTGPAPQLRPEMVVLEPGAFKRGDPEEEVNITRPFAIARTEVTQSQFAAVIGEDRIDESCLEEAGIGAQFPIVCVSWVQAVTYANELSDWEDLDPAYVIDGENIKVVRGANGYRLPTEAEWEYAARAGTQHQFVGTDDPSQACDYGNVLDRAAVEDWAGEFGSLSFECDDGYPKLAPVGALESNAWGLDGFGGNAAEWAQDWYGDYSTEPDPQVPNRGSDRAIRGGSWRSDPGYARVAFRNWIAPGVRGGALGFRLARSCLPFVVLPSDCLPARR